MNKLNLEFYDRDVRVVAKELLGKVLVHKTDYGVLRGRIVEVEAYNGVEDKAAHVYGGKKTPRVEPMYGRAGTSYVYFIYGLYYCFNVVVEKEGIPKAVLIRAIEPLDGIEAMCELRYKKPYGKLTKTQIKNLCNGPSKLCSALLIDKSLNNADLLSDSFYIEDDNFLVNDIVETTRIGIDYAEEAKDYLFRYYIKDNKFISKK